jgi:CHAT domain-containing protein/tetratricopeptide (TPR) repeat protein
MRLAGACGRPFWLHLRMRLIVSPPSVTDRAPRVSVGLMVKAGRAAWLGLAGLLLAPVAAVRAQSWESEAPCRVFRVAAHALAADSAASFRATWTERAARAPGDRFAALALASLDLWSGRLAAAESGFRAVAALPGNDAIARCAEFGVALALSSEGRWSSATAGFAHVAEIARAHADSLLEAQALLALVRLESRGRALQAAAHLSRADSMIPAADLARRAEALCVRANLLTATHAKGVAAAAAEGAALARRSGDRMIAADCAFSAAMDQALRGNMEVASHELALVIEEAHAARYVMMEAIALQWRGYAQLALGDYAAAQDDLERALALAQATGTLAVVGWSELNLAALFGSVGDWPSDRRHAARAHAVLASIGDSAGLGILRRSEARAALEVGDTAGARLSIQAALDAADRTGRHVDIVAARTAMADLELREGSFDSAAALLRSERALLSPDTRSAWELLLPWKEARVALARHDWREALRDLEAAEPQLDSSQHLFRYQLREDVALAELGLGDTARAINTLSRADDELELWRSTLGAADLRVLAFQTLDVITATSDAGAQVTAAAARQGRITAAFSFAERRRARELADQLRRADALRRGSGSPGPSAGEGRGLGAVAAITLAQVEHRIPDDSTVILEYVTGLGAPTTLITITRRGARGTILAAADSLGDAIVRYDALVDQGQSAEAPARQLGAALLAPVLASLPPGVRRIIVIPDGVLNGVAFGALRLPDGAPLLTRAAVSVAPSATVLVELWSRPRPTRTPLILAFGDPVLPHETGDIADTSAATELDAAGRLPRLPWTADEARVVGAFAPRSVVRLREEASASYLERTTLDGFSIIHFATHAIVDEEFPLRSALVLAPGDGRSGFVEPGDLAALHLTADLVVLSACRTARGQIVGGEGVRGLVAPILASGARSVLATRWRLNDRAAVPLVYAVYEGLAAGLPVSESVHRAELAAFRRGAPEREWAAFILVGDPLVRIDLRAPPPARVPEWLRVPATTGAY